jgi:predicted nucleic acid-binding protein
MTILFIDSDIILDILLERQPFFGAAAELLENESFQCFTSVHSLLNVHYFTKKKFGEQVTRNALRLLLQRLKIASEDSSHIHQALTSDFSDFEDAVQYFAASNIKADFIITRNTKDYKHSAIPVLTAGQFLLNTL